MSETATPLRAAAVGCGGAGRNHATGYRNAANAELVGVCDFDRERADALAAEYDVGAFYELSDLLDDVGPDSSLSRRPSATTSNRRSPPSKGRSRLL